MTDFFSPKEVATAIGVSESSLKRWVDKGLIPAEKTGGGHRRMTLDAVLRFLREQGRALSEPEAIGLPAESGRRPTSSDSDLQDFLRFLLSGDEPSARRIVMDAFLNGFSAAKIFDAIIVPAFIEIGNLWHCGTLEVYQERRACETCSRVVHELRRAVGSGPTDGPVAIGGTLDGDPYSIASSMSEVVLRECGWRALSLGNMLPFNTLLKAVENDRPRLMWLSVTSIRSPEQFAANLNVLFDTATSFGCVLVVGGQALTAEIRPMLRYTTYCDNFRHLEAFSKTIIPRDT
jgi:MerR family transcriptional regulator, light-induced transcriptional regulator